VVAIVIVGFGCAFAAVAFVWPLFLAAVFVIGFGWRAGARAQPARRVQRGGGAPRSERAQQLLLGRRGRGAGLRRRLRADTSRRCSWPRRWSGSAVIAGHGDLRRLPVDPTRAKALTPPGCVFIGAFVLYVAVETGTGGWMTSHLQSVGLPYASAAALTSGFFLALVAGRLIVTLVPPWVPESTIVLAGAVVATLALIAATVGALATVAYIVAGLAIAPIFPTGIVWLARLRPGDSRATSWLFPAASVDFAPLVFALSVVAIVYPSLVALAREVMTKLAAYSRCFPLAPRRQPALASSRGRCRGAVCCARARTPLDQIELTSKLQSQLDGYHPVVADRVGAPMKRSHRPAQPGKPRHLPSDAG
jgi:hypothetical protein